METSILPVEKRAFIRKIFLPEGPQKGFATPFVAYARIPYEGYVMCPHEMDAFDRCLTGYQEEEYPCDILDNAIFDALAAYYKKAERRSSLVLFSHEINTAKVLYENAKIISKDICIEVINNFRNLFFDGIRIPLRIYFPLNRICEEYPLVSYPLVVSYKKSDWDTLCHLTSSLVQYNDFIS